jgi:hypothetical protein
VEIKGIGGTGREERVQGKETAGFVPFIKQHRTQNDRPETTHIAVLKISNIFG